MAAFIGSPEYIAESFDSKGGARDSANRDDVVRPGPSIKISGMQVRVILVPYDSGHCRKRMGLGPERILSELKSLFTQRGIDFGTEEILLESVYPAEISAAFELCRKVSTRVRECRQLGILPFVLSGNCNTAVGTISGCGPDHLGVVWFDAHGESTTPETTRSGFLDGMSISILLGRAWSTLARSVPAFVPIAGNRIILFGARALEPVERILLDSAGVSQLTTVKQFASQLALLTNEVKQVYLHVDLDVLDPSVATANQWTPPNGISLDCLLEVIAEVRRKAEIAALGIASYDPAIDTSGRALAAAVSVADAALKSN